MQPAAIIIDRAGVRVVGALDEAFDDVVSGRDLAAGTNPYLVAKSHSHQRVVHYHQSVSERKPNVVFVFQRRCGSAAFGAVDDDEIGCRPFGEHRLADCQHVNPGTDTQLETHWFAAGQFAQPRHEPNQFARVAELGVRCRADTFLADRHASVFGNLLADLRRGGALRRHRASRLGSA